MQAVGSSWRSRERVTPHIGSGIEVARGGLSIPRHRDHRASQRDEGDDADRQRQEKNA